MRRREGHARRQRIISIVFLGALAAWVLAVAGCAKRLTRMEENQIRLQAMVAANARQLATISSQVHVADGEIQEGIRKLDLNDQDLATGVSTVQNRQDALHQTVASRADEIDRRMGTLDANQKLLQEGVSQVAGVAQRTASDVTAVAKEQVTLHEMVANGRRELTDSVATVAAGQDRLRSGLEGTDRLMHTVAGDVTTISQGQVDLHRAVNEHSSLLADKAAIMERNQQNLQGALEGIAGQIRTNADGITAVDARQAALQQTVVGNHKIVTGQVAAVIENQQGLQAGVNGLSDKIGQTNAQLTALAAGQDAVRETIRNDNGTVTARLAGLSESQTGLHRKADILASNVGTVQAGQESLRDTLKANHEAVAGQVAQLSSEQQCLQDQVDALLATAGQTGLDIVALGDSNAALQRAIQAGTTSLAERTDRLDAGLAALTTQQSATRKAMTDQSATTVSEVRKAMDDQRQLANKIDGLAAAAGQTAGDVKAVAARQETIQRTLENRNDAAGRQIAGLAASQQQIQNDLDAVVATAGQTALDVLAVASRQDALRQDLQDHNKTVNSRMTGLAGGQGQIQSSLDVVTATSGQTALDTITLNEAQTRLTLAVQADRQALADRLAEIVQSQQQWAQRFDAAQANVQNITASLTALEQHLTKLQGTLEPSLDGLTSQLGADGQSRTQFEAGVNHDIQAVVEAIAQLRQDQVSLRDQMEQMQAGTQTQTTDILTAIQQLRLPPAEVKVSDSRAKLESSVAEAAAK